MSETSNVEVNNGTSAAIGEDGGPVKSAKQLKKEAEKAAKLQKLQEKLDKKAAETAASSTKEKPEVSMVRVVQCIELLMQYQSDLTYLTVQSHRMTLSFHIV